MYDHNQTSVPDSFVALHVRRGRLLLGRKELEARYEIAETLALQIAGVVSTIPADDEADRREALARVAASLRVEPAEVSDVEASWVISRVEEILAE